VMRVDTEDGERRFCCCVAAYGYMGDLMRESERLRWLGPSRYNLAGALSLLKNKVPPAVPQVNRGRCPEAVAVQEQGQGGIRLHSQPQLVLPTAASTLHRTADL